MQLHHIVAAGGAACLVLAAQPAIAQRAPTAEQKTRLDAMWKAADDLDEAADPAAYRKAWEAVIAYGRTLYPADHPELAWLEAELITADYLQGDIKGAAARADSIAARYEKAGAAYHHKRMELANAQVVILMTLSEHDRARQLAARVLEYRLATSEGKASTTVAAAYSNYANAEMEFGNYDKAIELVRKAIAEDQRLDPIPPNAAPHFANLPTYLLASGRLEEATEAARSTQEVLERIMPKGHPYLAINLATLARVLVQLGRGAEAEAAARKAVDIAVARFGQSQQVVSYMSALAQALTLQGKTDEAQTVAKAAADILTKDLGAEADRTLVARDTYAEALAAAGKRSEALALLNENTAIRARKLPPFHRDRIGGADRLADLAVKLGDLPVAKTAQTEAQALRRTSMPADDIAALSGEARLGAIEARGGDAVAGLKRALAAAAGLDEQLRRANAAGSRRSGRDRAIRTGYGWALDAALAAGDTQAAFALAQRVMEGSAGRAVREAAARTAVGDAAVAKLLRDRQDAAIELEALLDRQLRIAGRGAPAEQIAQVDTARRAAAAKLEQLTQALRTRAPQLLAAEEAPPQSLAAVQAALAPDEALLVTATGPARTGVIFVSREQVALHHVDRSGEQVAALVDRLRDSMSPGAVGTGKGFDFAASADLHAMLLPQPVSALLKGKRRVLVAANGALAALPFATLAPKQARPTLASAHWLIRDHALVTLPTIASIAERREAGDRRVASYVAVGAPELHGAAAGRTAFRSANLARQVRELPPLPATANELRALGAALSASHQTILTGAQATESSVRATALQGADVLAFATHGLTAGELEGLEEPALVMTPADADDGLLTASEIMRLRLDADWVILSACNTAAGDGTDDSGLAGLARAFLYAGGRNLLASHWSVRDDAAAYLSVQTVKRYATGTDPAEALRQAMLQMIARKPFAGADQPAHWAPFVFVGR